MEGALMLSSRNKPTKQYLVSKICDLANLPTHDGSEGRIDFTQQQLTELAMYLEHVNKLLRELRNAEKEKADTGNDAD